MKSLFWTLSTGFSANPVFLGMDRLGYSQLWHFTIFCEFHGVTHHNAMCPFLQETLWYHHRLGLTLVACRPPKLLQGLRSLDQPTLDPENLLLTTRHVCKELWYFPVKIMSKSAPRPRTLPSRVDNKELHRETRTIIANFDREHQEPLGRAKLDNNHIICGGN